MTPAPNTADRRPDTKRRTKRSTWPERIVVLAGLALAAFWTAVASITGFGTAAIGPLWLAVIAWTVVSSLALALLRGFRHGDWSAFRHRRLPDGRDERIDAATQSGQHAWMEVAEEHERLMRD